MAEAESDKIGWKGCDLSDKLTIKLLSSRKKVFAAAEEAGNVERNDGRRLATVAASEASTTAAKHGHRVAKTFPAYLRSSTKTVFPAKFAICIIISDESVLVKRKYNVGHLTTGMQQWIFVIFDCKKRVGIIEFVEDRSAATLIPIIKKYCLPGTIMVYLMNMFL